MTHCTGKLKATVTLIYSTKVIERITSNNPPIKVDRASINNTDVCWRFEGEDGDSEPEEVFACGNNPNWVLVNTPNHPKRPGMWARPAFNSIPFLPSNFVFAPGSYSVDASTFPIVRRVRRPDYSVGNCDNCSNQNTSCSIQISDMSGVVYQKDFTNCPETLISCDEECPEDTIRCEQPGYPGHCCLPCQPIAQRINSLAARL